MRAVRVDGLPAEGERRGLDVVREPAIEQPFEGPARDYDTPAERERRDLPAAHAFVRARS